MKCSEAIKNNLCLGCVRLEYENANREADCGYIKSGLDVCKEILEGKQIKF